MSAQPKYDYEERRRRVKNVERSYINGIDYLEVKRLQSDVIHPLILVYCLKKIKLEYDNLRVDVRIEGGVRVKDIKADWVQRADKLPNDLQNEIQGDPEKVIVIRPSKDGDFSIYKLRLVHPENPELPPEGFDYILSKTDLNFKIECPSEFDCLPQKVCPIEVSDEPIIDYMAKDYASFRRLMLNRLSTIMPGWKETNPADMSVALVDLLAYVGDHLSYYQDSVATEAYLGTARKRISIKRHVRLLDYFIHEGCNSRVWICIDVNKDEVRVPKGTKLLTGKMNDDPVVGEDEFEEASRGNEIFETMHDAFLYKANNIIWFYTWGESKRCLPIGSTSATVRYSDNKIHLHKFNWDNVPGNEANGLKEFLVKRYNIKWIEENDVNFLKNEKEYKISASNGVHSLTIILDDEEKIKAKSAMLTVDNKLVDKFNIEKKGGVIEAFALRLRVGDVLIFEEQFSPETLKQIDADPSHRCALRLTGVKAATCELNYPPLPVIEITWDPEDALCFPLWLEEFYDPEEKEKSQISIAHGNVVLADHGGTTCKEELGDVPEEGIFSPRLPHRDLTYAGPFDPSVPASLSLKYDVREALPDITLQSRMVEKKKTDGIEEVFLGEAIPWSPKRDLLASNKFANEFVVEMDNDRTAHIMFGDGVNGRRPLPSTEHIKNSFTATYRIGVGRRGNVGANTITRIAEKKIEGEEEFFVGSIGKVCNPMEASGGIDSENIEEVRLYAPQAFRTQKRAVTEDDYSDILANHSEVQKAAAVLRWTGSWYTYFVTIDRKGGKEVDRDFKTDIQRFLSKYRLAGYDVEVNGPIYVPLNIKVKVCVAHDYFPSEVKKELIDVFSNRDLPNGKRGFFHPDNFTLGQPVYLSRLYETAMKVDGVYSITFEVFQRWEEKFNGDALSPLPPVIDMHFLEVARLDNDPNFPENGKIEFIMEGGQ